MTDNKRNFTLYVKTGCAYSTAVIHKMEDLGLSWSEKNVGDIGVYDELEKRGGRRQEPYLIDDNTGFEMYESGMIIDYLERNYNKGK